MNDSVKDAEEECRQEGKDRNAPDLSGQLPKWFASLLNRKLELPKDEFQFLQDLRAMFPRLPDRTLAPCATLDDVSDLDEETQELLIQNDEECKKMADFVERTRDFMKCRQTTLSGPDKRSWTKEKVNEYYLTFRDYLCERGFFKTMTEVMYQMFLLQPSLPEDPIAYIRQNYGIRREEATALLQNWLELQSAVDALEAENKDLKERLEIVRVDLRTKTAVEEEPVENVQKLKRNISARKSVSRGRSRRSSVWRMESTPQMDKSKELELGELVWEPARRGERKAAPDAEQRADTETSADSDYSLTSMDSVV